MKLNEKKIKIRKCRTEDYWFCYYLLKRNMFDYIEKYRGGWDSKRHRTHFKKKNIKVVEYINKIIGLYHVEKKKKKITNFN